MSDLNSASITCFQRGCFKAWVAVVGTRWAGVVVVGLAYLGLGLIMLFLERVMMSGGERGVLAG